MRKKLLHYYLLRTDIGHLNDLFLSVETLLQDEII